MGKARFLIIIRSIAIFSLVIFLNACGGGGGSSSPAKSSAEETYSGETNQAALTSSNAQYLAEGALWGALSASGNVITIGAMAAGRQNTSKVPLMGCLAKTSADLGRMISGLPVDHVPGLGVSSETAAPVTIPLYEEGENGGTLTGSMQMDQSTGSFTGTATYVDYNDGDTISNGKVSFHGNMDMYTQDISDITIIAKALTVAFDGETIIISGSTSTSYDGNLVSTRIDICAREAGTGLVYWFNDYQVNMLAHADCLEMEISGRFYDPDYGYVDMITRGPIIIPDEGDGFSGGDVIITGAPGSSGGNARARYSAVAEYLEVDADGNGLFEWNTGDPGADINPPAPGAGVTFSDLGPSKVTISWGAASDDATPQAGLSYKVVGSPVNNLDTIFNAHKNGMVIMDWTPDRDICYLVGFITYPGSYYFAVLVKDAAGNEALYAQQQPYRIDNDPPVPGSRITFGDIQPTGVTISWGEAWDAATSTSGLSYKVVFSPAGNLDTIDDAENNGTVVMDWAVGARSCTLSGYTGNPSTCYFAVLVKDEAGNKALYAQQTPWQDGGIDTQPPVSGAGITFSDLGPSKVTISWGAALDNVTPQAELLYKVVGSPSGNLDTIPHAESNGMVIMDWSPNRDICYLVGFITYPGSYYFAVLVKDVSGNVSLYPQRKP